MEKLEVAALGIGFFLAALLTDTQALKDVRIYVPSAVVRGEDALLICSYDLEGDQLYSVKWYLGTKEFYRYTPKENPPIKQFRSQSGLKVRESESNSTQVVLEHVPMSVSGRYSCEVSADAPSFYTYIQSAHLQVVDLPLRDPYISEVKPRYHHGDILRANCTSEHSNPAANVTWYINGQPAKAEYVHNYHEKSSDGRFHTVHSILRLKISKHLFLNHQRLKIRCAVRMYDLYQKSHEKSIETGKRRHYVHAGVDTNTAAPSHWGLAQATGTNPETTLIFKSSPSERENGAASVSTTSIAFIVIISLLR